MFDWFFRKKENNDNIKDLLKILKNGITINININGELDAKKRTNFVAERVSGSEINAGTVKITKNKEGKKPSTFDDSIPNFSKIKRPKVNFGEETEF